jgi:hypothetical protein
MTLISVLQPAEKQLAATTTDLATNNPMRLLPIVAVLIAIVLLLVILAVIFVIIIRGRNGCANSSTTSLSTAGGATGNYLIKSGHGHGSSNSLRQPHQPHILPLETTAIDDYHHNTVSPHYGRPHKQHQVLAANLNSPDLILPASKSEHILKCISKANGELLYDSLRFALLLYGPGYLYIGYWGLDFRQKSSRFSP